MDAAEPGLCQETPCVHLSPVAPGLFGLATAMRSFRLNSGNQPITIFHLSWEIIYSQGKSCRDVLKMLKGLKLQGLLLT